MKKAIHFIFLITLGIVISSQFLPTGLLVTGFVQYANGFPLGETIDINYSNAVNGTTSTNVNGQFTVNENLALGNMLTLRPVSPAGDCPSECINLYDVYLLQQHLISSPAFSTPYQSIVADINNSQSLSSLDRISLIRYIIGIDANWTNNTCLRFIDDSYVFPDPSNPWVESFPESTTITYDGSNIVNFTAIRIGDISSCVETPVDSDLEIFVNDNPIVSQGSNIQIPVKVNNFTQINGFQFTVEWDPNVINYLGIASTNPILPGFNLSSIGQTEAGLGFLRVAWVSPSGPINFPDGSILFNMDFEAIGAPGSSTLVDVSGSRTPLLGLDNTVQPILPTAGGGSVTIEGGGDVEINIGSAMASVGEQLCIPFTVNNFNDILGFQFSINYDPTIVQFDNLQNFAPLPGFDSSNFGNPSSGDITITWNGNSGQNLPDGSVLFELCFTGLQIGLSDIVISNNPTIIEIINSQGDVLQLASTPGEIIIDEIGNEPCPDLSITPTPLDTTGHNCCFILDFDNTGNIPVYAIELEALGGVSLDYTLPIGYFDPNNDLFSVLISPQPLGAIPDNVQGLAEICLSNVFVNPQQVVVNYWNSDYEVFCTDTLLFDCPIEPMCLDIVSDTLTCDTVGYNYSVNVQVPPGSDFDIGLIKLTITEPTALAGEYSVPFNPELSAGDQATLNFPLPSPPIYSALDSLCLILTAHNGPEEQLCCFALDTCIAFPVCDPCPQVGVNAKPLDTCCYRLELANNYLDVPGYFTQIQTTIINSNAYFSSINYDLNAGWLQNAVSTNNDILWGFNNAVPTGIYDLFDFCIDGMTTTDSVCIAVNWINNEEVICTDTVKVFCPQCILITEDEISCDPQTGIYTYTFSGENWSVDYDANTISFLENDPNFDIQPASVLLGASIPPYGGFGPVSLDIVPTGALPGDTLCFDMVLRNVIQDSINIECCYVTHCIVLPECEMMAPICDCENLEIDGQCGFNIDVDCYDLTFTPFCLLDECDEVFWQTGFGGFIGTTIGNQPISTTVNGPGIYTFMYQITRTDDFGNVCVSANYGQNIDVPLCEPCPNISCVPPADINLLCSDLPLGFDPNDTSTFPTLFGEPTAGNCSNYSWVENAPDFDLDNCNSGGIIRHFTVEDNFGNSSTCQQIITIGTNINYAIRFPADYSGDCTGFDSNIAAVEVINSACEFIAISVVDEDIDPVNTDICREIIRTYQVINWCEYNGQSGPIIIDRDEDCDGLTGEEDVWVIVNNTGTYIDMDNDASNAIPAADIRGTSCDGQSNPAGHWRNNTTHPALASIGFWEYTQRITITGSAPVVYNITNNSPYCTNNNFDCSGPVQIIVDLSADCDLIPTSTLLFYDDDVDGNYEAIFNLDPDGTVTILSGPANVSVSGGYPVWIVDISDVSMGNHLLAVQGQNACEGAGLLPIPFEVIDCTAPDIICIDGLSLELADVNPPADVDGDGDLDNAALMIWAVDFLAANSVDCSPPVTYSINQVGQVVDINQQGIFMTCDEVGTVQVEVHVWDPLGNQNTCLPFVIVQDPNDFCSGNSQSPTSQLRLFPNPVRNQLSIQTNRIGAAKIHILHGSGQAAIETNIETNRQNQTIDISQLSPGIYWLRLQYNDGELLYERFIKM